MAKDSLGHDRFSDEEIIPPSSDPTDTSETPSNVPIPNVVTIGSWTWDLVNDKVIGDENLIRLYGIAPDAVGGGHRHYLDAIHPEDRPKLEQAIDAAINSTGILDIENRVVLPDGSVKWVLTRGTVIKDEQGLPISFPGLVLDITDRKEREEVLARSEAHFRALADAVPTFVWTTDPDGRATYFNSRFYEYTGLTVEESLGFGFAQIFHPDDKEPSLTKWRRAWEEGAEYQLEYRIRRHDGQYRWFEGRGEPVCDPETGKVTGWAGTCTDINDRHQVEQLARSASRVLQTVNDAYITLDREFRITSANLAAARINRKRQDEFIGNLCWDEWPALINSEVELQYRGAMLDRLPRQFLHHYVEDGVFDVWVDISVYPASDEDGGGLHLVYRDVSDTAKREQRDAFLTDLSKRFKSLSTVEEVIADSVSSLGAFLKASCCYFSEIDLEGATAVVHPDYCGPGIPSAAGTWSTEKINPNIIDSMRDGLAFVVDDAQEIGDQFPAGHNTANQPIKLAACVVVPLVRKLRLVSAITVCSSTPRKWNDDEVKLIKEVGERTWLTIDTLRHDEAVLKELEQRREISRQQAMFTALVQNSTDFIGYSDLNRRSIFVNKAGRRLIGLEDDDLKDDPVSQMLAEDYFYPDDVPFVLDNLLPHIMQNGCGGAELRLKHFKTGEPIWVNYSAFTVPDSETGHLAALMTITRDIREQRQAQDALREKGEYLNRLVESSPDCIMTLALDGKILSMNEGSQRTFTSRHDGTANNIDWLDLWADDVSKKAAEEARQGALENRRVQFEGFTFDPDGAERWWDVLTVPLLGRDNRPEQLLAVLRDNTDRHHLHVEEHARAERDAVLARIGSAIRQSLPPSKVQAVAVEALGRSLGADRCYYATVDIGADQIVCVCDYAVAGLTHISGEYKISELGMDLDRLFPNHQNSVVTDTLDISSAPWDQKTSQIVDGLGVRSSLTVPFFNQNGELTGILAAAMARSTREWMPEEILLVEQVATETVEAVKAAQAQQRERNIARQLQDALLPPAPPQVDGLEISSYYRPALDEAAVGGDGFDVFAIEPNCTAICVFDLTGKGLQAASQVATVRNMARYAVYTTNSLAEAMQSLNDTLVSYNLLEGFTTIFLATYDRSKGTITYINCGQEPALLWRADRKDVIRLEATCQALGAFAGGTFVEKILRVSQGDVIAVFTDGLTEIGTSRRNLLEIDGFSAIFQESVTKSLSSSTKESDQELHHLAPKIKDEIIGRVEAITGGADNLRDDIALLVCVVTDRSLDDNQTLPMRRAGVKRRGSTSTISEEGYRAFIGNSSEGIWRFDCEKPIPLLLPEEEQIAALVEFGYLAEANDAFARIYGQSIGSEIVGISLTNILDAVYPENRHVLQMFIRSNYRLADAESVVRDRSGKLRYINNTLVGVIEDGCLVRAWGTQRDVTDHRAMESGLRESEARFRALADNIGQLAWIADPTGNRTWFNQRWFQYTGLTFEQSKDWNWNSVHHPDYAEKVSKKFQNHLDSGEPWEDTFPIRGKDGSYRWFLSRAFPTRDDHGDILLWCGTNTDVTAEREAQEALMKAESALRTTTLLQRKFVREMLASVTEGKLVLCDDTYDFPNRLSNTMPSINLHNESPGHLRQQVKEAAELLRFPVDRLHDLVTAVGEAAMNAVNHGGGGTGQVYFDPVGRIIQVWISDQGTGIREEDLPRATLEKGWSGSGSLGHGFFLMLNTVDRTYLLTSAMGTTIILEQSATDSQSNSMLKTLTRH